MPLTVHTYVKHVIIHYLDNPIFQVSDNAKFEHTHKGKQHALEIRDKIREEGGGAEIFGGDLVSFLASEKAEWITGQIIKVSGGHNIRQ